MPKVRVIAVGASAGGLDALSELLAHLPANSGRALVLIQHLQADRESLLPRLLQKHTSLPVAPLEDGAVPKRNHVYVMPAGKQVRLREGRLRLDEADKHRHPIDAFMLSLAEQAGAAATGVVLSGSGNDGTAGLAAICAAGGCVWVQDPDTAEHDEMPRSAIAELGRVPGWDGGQVLAPAEIGRRLGQGRASAAPTQAGGHSYREVLAEVRRATGVDFSSYRASTLQRRLARRMAQVGASTLHEYRAYLRAHADEPPVLFESLLIPTTKFFRDPAVFEFLKSHTLAQFVRERHSANRPLRLWSVGCSTGEEAYSLAMVGLEALAAGGGGGSLQVFGTDISPAALRRARSGRYPGDIAHSVGKERLQRFFTTDETGGYRVSKVLRDACVFAHHDVTRDAPFAHLDVICFRNVMIYMESALQSRVLATLHYALNPEGALVLGSAESASAAPPGLFRPMGLAAQHKLKAYASVVGSSAARPRLGAAAGVHRWQTDAPAPARPRSHDNLRQQADRIVLEHFAPAGVIVDANLQVLEFRGRTSPYLEPAPGAASLNVARMARGTLGAYIRTAVAAARQSGQPVERRGLAGGLDLHVWPLGTAFLVLFVPAAPRPEPRGRQASSSEVLRLRRQLADSEEQIRALSLEFQDSKQGYQAAAEEAASATEELQSSNEELETSKEELQSANEEINTVNDELRHLNAELQVTNTDLQNLINVPNFAVLMLDRELRIRRFSPHAARLFRLLPSDQGRPMSDLHGGFPGDRVEKAAESAIATGETQNREFRDGEERGYQLAAHCYRDSAGRVAGVVIVLVEI